MCAKIAKKGKETVESDEPFFDKMISFFSDQRTKYGIGIVLLVATAYLSLSFISFTFTGASDYSLVEKPFQELTTQDKRSVQNWAGLLGAYLSNFFINKSFGVASFALLFMLLVFALRLMKVRFIRIWKAIVVSIYALVWLSVSISFFFSSLYENSNVNWGGEHGTFVSTWMELNIGKSGAFLVIFATFIIFCIFSYRSTVPLLQKAASTFWLKFKSIFKRKKKEKIQTEIDEEINELESVLLADDDTIPNYDSPQLVEEDEDETCISSGGDREQPAEAEFEIEVAKNDDNVVPTSSREAELILSAVKKDDEKYDASELGEYDPKADLSRYVFPPLELLRNSGSNEGQVNIEEQNANKNRITTTLRNYGIEIDSIKATVGPTITLYEIVPKAGVRISKIKNLESDIMLSLAATGIRIIAPIPGKGTIGIEVPNNDPQMVSMYSIIASKKFQESKFQLPVAFGRTITNDIFMVDLCKMPHLLVAGATGQGKSVGLNAIITSLLYKKHPSYLKFVLVDPKKVEFNIYSKIEKHFLAKLPDEEEAIITDVSKVVQTLNSLTKEMDERYDLLKKAHVRNIAEYNEKFIHRRLNPEKGHRFLPYIVVVIDEFGDLIMVAGKEVELPIARIAQLARAVGIHMIIATQRPSVNIITGVIKANFPARVAFRVSSQIDSRTILDAAGANQLVGRGDMLFSQGSDLVRVQCAFVDTPEVENISDFIGQQMGFMSPFYLPEYVAEGAEGSDLSGVDLSKRDPMFEEAARLLVAHQQGSTSLIQRKFSIGYNRAGRIMDQLEVAGIVGPFEGSKARQVLIPDDYSLEQKLSTL